MSGQENEFLSGHIVCYEILAAIHLPRCLVIKRDSMNITPILSIWSTIAQLIFGVMKVKIYADVTYNSANTVMKVMNLTSSEFKCSRDKMITRPTIYIYNYYIKLSWC